MLQFAPTAGAVDFQKDSLYTTSSSDYYYTLVFNITGATLCILFVGLLSSMFLGLLTLDPLDLKVKQRAAIGEEKEYATRLLPVVEQYHRLLVTLLLLNALAYEALPLFLDNLLPTWATICLSVTFLLIFGEIIPSAIFTGPEQLRLASNLVPLVRFFLFVMYPFAMPLVKLLDYLVPEDPNQVRYHRGELSALVRIQYEQRGDGGIGGGAAGAGAGAGEESSNRRRRRKQKQKQKQHLWKLGKRAKDGDKDDDISISSDSDDSSSSSIGVSSPTSTPHQHNKTKKRSFYKGNATWRNFKREILEAVRERVESATTTTTTNATNGGITEEDLESLARNVRLNLLPPPLDSTEIQVVQGALNMKTRVAMDVYTPIRNIFAVPSNMILNKAKMTRIYANGYSRVPVYEPSSEELEEQYLEEEGGGGGSDLFELSDSCLIKGILMTRQLILIDWDDERRVDTLPIQNPPCVSPRMNLVDLLHLLQNGGSLMAFVCARPDVATKAMDEGRAIPPEGGFMGLVTLEDVLESIIQETILDEIDMTHRTLASARLTHWAATVLQRFMKKKRKADVRNDHQNGGSGGEQNNTYSIKNDNGEQTTKSTPTSRVVGENEIDLEAASESTALLNGHAKTIMTFSSV